MGMQRYRETIRCFERSKEILGRVPDFEQLVTQLTYEIENLRSRVNDKEEGASQNEVKEGHDD